MSFDLEDCLRELDGLQRATDDWSATQRDTLNRLRGHDDDLQREAWQRVLGRLRERPELAPVLRELAADPVVYALWRRLGLLRASLDERIDTALKPVRPLLHAHGGDVEIVEIQPPDTLLLRMTGACDGCPASAITLTAGVIRAIRSACPELVNIRDVTAGALTAMPSDTVSPFAGEQP